MYETIEFSRTYEIPDNLINLVWCGFDHRAENVSMRIESTINAENQLLRDQLSRERSLRKQIEADKHELQSQLLESKDRLHHLSSSLKQKDSTMKKLDQVCQLALFCVQV